MRMTFELAPIGYVASSVEEDRESWDDVVSRIELLPEHAEGLEGLEAFSHVFVVTYLHRAEYEGEDAEKHPCGIKSMPLVGVFARRAKERPNPIGLTVVKLLGVGQHDLEVQGLDAVNGTPVLDIKPYIPEHDSIPDAVVPRWVDKLDEQERSA